MKRPIFAFTDYKEYLKRCITEAKPSRGFMTKLAQAAGCKSSYLSAVLKSKVNLTPDHANGLCRFLKLSDLETDFFMLMLEFERSANRDLRRRIETKMKILKTEQEKISNRVRANVLQSGSPELRYYYQWYWMAVHLITSIPEFQRSPKTIAEKLQLQEPMVRQILEELIELGYVKFEQGRWLYSNVNYHLSNQSPEVILHHNNWRQRAILSASNGTTDSIHYTSVMTLSRNDFELLKTQILLWINESRSIAEPSPGEEMVCFNLDYFKV